MVTSFTSPNIVPWCYRSRWKHCIAMSKCLTFKVSHIVREGNKCVHSLASMGVDLKQDFSWYENIPDCISHDFFRNKFGLLVYRFF